MPICKAGKTGTSSTKSKPLSILKNGLHWRKTYNVICSKQAKTTYLTMGLGMGRFGGNFWSTSLISRMLPVSSVYNLDLNCRQVWPRAASSCLSSVPNNGGWHSETSACLGTEGVCRSAMGLHAVTSAWSLHCAAGQGLKWTEGADVERGPPHTSAPILSRFPA